LMSCSSLLYGYDLTASNRLGHSRRRKQELGQPLGKTAPASWCTLKPSLCRAGYPGYELPVNRCNARTPIRAPYRSAGRLGASVWTDATDTTGFRLMCWRQTPGRMPGLRGDKVLCVRPRLLGTRKWRGLSLREFQFPKQQDDDIGFCGRRCCRAGCPAYQCMGRGLLPGRI
jgi:hypothetical protein